MISFKNVYFQPEAANNDMKKEMKKQYAEKVTQLSEEGKIFMFVDESNVNFFCVVAQEKVLQIPEQL